jgi:hypothetical protein
MPRCAAAKRGQPHQRGRLRGAQNGRKTGTATPNAKRGQPHQRGRLRGETTERRAEPGSGGDIHFRGAMRSDGDIHIGAERCGGRCCGDIHFAERRGHPHWSVGWCDGDGATVVRRRSDGGATGTSTLAGLCAFFVATVGQCPPYEELQLGGSAHRTKGGVLGIDRRSYPALTRLSSRVKLGLPAKNEAGSRARFGWNRTSFATFKAAPEGGQAQFAPRNFAN